MTFVWSTEEEVGLKGAAAFAEQAAKEGRVPDFVFAIDTFVSSDSPLESKRFGDAEIGKGFVVRAVDNSNIVPREYVDRVVALAKENSIPAQYGVTGGGNDGCGVHAIWIGGRGAGLAAALLAFTGRSDRHQGPGRVGENRGSHRAQMVMTIGSVVNLR